MRRSFVLVYGIVSYLIFLAVILYLVGFIGDFLVPKTINSGVGQGPLRSVLIDTGLILLFALQHLIMARGSFKAWLARYVPEPIERSTFVLASSLCLFLLCMFWQPVPVVVWRVEDEVARFILDAFFSFGWLLMLYATFLIDHFDLFGLRQVYLNYRRKPYSKPPFKVHSLYRYVRHPMMLGVLIALWAAPEMSVGRLILATGFSAFIFVGLWFEERELAKSFGQAYQDYRQNTSMVIPLPRRKGISDTPSDKPSGGGDLRCSNGTC